MVAGLNLLLTFSRHVYSCDRLPSHQKVPGRCRFALAVFHTVTHHTLPPAVVTAGLQILLSIFGGWLCARLRLADPEVMSRNVNLFAMKGVLR
jgi:hypothetical protein